MFHASAKHTCLLSVTMIMTLSTLGCGGGVREDRAAEFSKDGKRVAFQHGKDGVFVASPDGKGLTKIFQPDASVIATSRPLASPTDGRLIFTTAEPFVDEQSPRPNDSSPTPAEGRVFAKQAVRYTCWLRSEPKGEQPAEVKKLFTSRCGHVGYVSAGLAVRWHPDGQHLVYCEALDEANTQHSVFEFDLTTEKSRRVFPHSVNDVVFDWTPAGSHLVCVASVPGNPDSAVPPAEILQGTWVGKTTDEKSWWRVPGSEQLASGELNSDIERLRASRPVWTRDDTRFAFVTRKSPREEDPVKQRIHLLHRVEFADRTIVPAIETDGPISDLSWSPDGQRLGFLQRGASDANILSVVDQIGKINKLPTNESIGKFAGFDTTGQHLGYVVASLADLPPESQRWSLLLIPDVRSRDRVRIAQANASDVGTDVFSGVRVTFPQWSPTEEKLSLWLTFMPRYRSLLSMVGQGGLRPGDPAATIDTKTGTIAWMAVTPQEELQIAHYYLMKHEAAEAWKWYEKARQQLPEQKPPTNRTEFLRQVSAPENILFFEFLCLKRLGKDADAAGKLLEFETKFYPPLDPPPAVAKPANEPAAAPVAEPAETAFGPDSEFLRHLIHDLYIAEVCLSVDSLDEALTYFNGQPDRPDSEAVALSRALVLAQLQLISRDNAGYLEHCTNVAAPLALGLWQPEQVNEGPNPKNQALQLSAGACLAPLFRKDFLAGLPPEVVQKHRQVWQNMAEKYQSGVPAVAIQLVLRAIALRLDDAAAAKAAEARIAANPAASQLFADKPIDEVIGQMFQFVQGGLGEMLAR